MLRLPSDRLECPKVEPSQVLCPHWMLVVAHQGLRECYYIAMDMKRTLAKKMCCCCPHAKASSYKVLSEGTPVVPKRVLFVRHGQGAHNETIKNWGLVDPELTEVGEAQVADLHERLKSYIPQVDLIVVSPL